MNTIATKTGGTTIEKACPLHNNKAEFQPPKSGGFNSGTRGLQSTHSSI